jgi:glycosyltransferase involved in cell wall biosynthesis
LTRGPDLVWIQRKMYPKIFAGRLARGGGPVVLDLDDAVDLPPPDRTCSASAHRRYRQNFEATAHRADIVLCGNRELAARLPHDRFEIVPTPIDIERFAPHRLGPARAKLVGWVGHSSNFSYLDGLAEPLRELARRHPGLVLRVVADRPPQLPGLTVEFQRWSLENEISCFDGLSAGLMPLADTPWARSKCAFKAIQYMALGIPAVVSPVGMNLDLVRHADNGLLAADDRAWIDAIDRVLSDPALAARLARAGRQTVVERYSLEVVSTRIAELFRDLIAARGQKRRPVVA